jgi:integrase
MTWTPTAGMTDKQVQKELERQKVLFEEQAKGGNSVDNRNIRFSDFCTDYLEITKQALAPRTWETYKKVINQRIIPVLGHLRLSHIHPLHVQRFIQPLEEPGRYFDRNGNPAKDKRLSSQSIQRFIAVFKSVLSRAAKLELISSNPASSEKIDLPKGNRLEVQIFDKEQAKAERS